MDGKTKAIIAVCSAALVGGAVLLAARRATAKAGVGNSAPTPAATGTMANVITANAAAGNSAPTLKAGINSADLTAQIARAQEATAITALVIPGVSGAFKALTGAKEKIAEAAKNTAVDSKGNAITQIAPATEGLFKKAIASADGARDNAIQTNGVNSLAYSLASAMASRAKTTTENKPAIDSDVRTFGFGDSSIPPTVPKIARPLNEYETTIIHDETGGYFVSTQIPTTNEDSAALWRPSGKLPSVNNTFSAGYSDREALAKSGIISGETIGQRQQRIYASQENERAALKDSYRAGNLSYSEYRAEITRLDAIVQA